MAAINKNKEDGGNPLVVFSGNAFSPSMSEYLSNNQNNLSLNILSRYFMTPVDIF